jgi:hypothetical protein
MINGDAAFAQEFFHITIAQGIPQVPPHRAEDDSASTWRYVNRGESLMAGLR